MNSKIWLSSPHMSGNEIDYIQEAFSTNWIAPLGPLVDRFETRISELTDSKAVALSSGTSALHLALILLNVGPGDDVFCQSFTFVASANPIIYQRANPVFIDSEKDTWNMDPELLEDALNNAKNKNKLPKAIIIVHLYGMPAKMSEIMAIANKFDVPVIEDSAEALGSSLNGVNCGSFGMFGVISFNGNKIITTSGGGALVCKNAQLIEKAKFLASQARDDAPHYEHSTIGYNYRLSNVSAGIGLGQLEVLTERVQQRRRNFKTYRDFFDVLNSKGYNIRFQEELSGYYSNRWLTTILIDPKRNNGINREKIRKYLSNHNIESRPLWKPLHLQPIFKNCKSFKSGVCETLFENGLCLPSGSNLSKKDLTKIKNALGDVFNNF